VQTDAFPENQASVVICQLTSELVNAPYFRVTIEPKPGNGLRLKSQVMADKPVTVRRERIGQKIGRLGNQDMARLGIALAFVLGLAD
jgi:mRNA interferase MazF